MSFDPDKYLAGTKPARPAFDPDEYLKDTPQSGVAADTAKRVGRSLVDQPGAIVQALGTIMDLPRRASDAVRDYMMPARSEEDAAAMEALKAKERAAFGDPATVTQETGKQMRKDQGELYTGDFAPDKARDRNLLAKVADSSGSMAAAVATPGGVVAKTLTGAALNSQGAADEAEQIMLQKGASKEEARDEAARQFVLNLPAGALESVAWGKLFGRYGNALREAVSEKFGKDALRRIVRATAEQALIEGGEEATQQLWQNVAAKGTFDKDRELTAGVKDAAVVGSIMGGGMAGAVQTGAEVADKLTDTGRNRPETSATLELQQRQLVNGERVAQMFPTGTAELSLPKGMQRIETERGVFHYNPGRLSKDEVESISAQGKENLILGLGRFDKAEVMRRAEAGEPLATVTERAPDGTEARSAVVVPSTQQETQADMEAGKSPGNTVRTESLMTTLRKREDQGKEATQSAAAAEEKQRTERFQEKQGRRERFDETMRVARETLHWGNAAPYAQLEGALNAVRFYAEDNSVGLLPEQKAAAVKATRMLDALVKQRRPEEDARKAAEQQQRAAAGANQQREQKARIDAERAALAAREREVKKTGLDPETKARLYDKAPEAVLTKWAAEGDKKAERRLMEIAEAPAARGGDDLLTVLKRVKLPSEDATLREELAKLRDESVNFGERQQLFTGKPGSLDSVAEVLRVEHGFSDIKTPADVIDFAERALRGEQILPDWRESAAPAFARGKQTALTEAEVESRWQSMRQAFPELQREWVFVRGEVQDVLAKAGYTGEVPEDVQASVLPPELLEMWQQKRAERGLIVFAERMLSQPGKAARLMLHELGHHYWDTLPGETREALRDLYARETEGRTGPLFDAAGEPATDIKFLPEDFTEAELRDDPDLPLREWFAERLAQVNASWANGRISSRDTLISRLAFELREILQRVQRWLAKQQGRRAETPLLEREFRRFLRQGARQLDARGRAEAVNFARDGRPEFARKRTPARAVADVQAEIDQVQQQLDSLKESNEPAEEIEARGATLTAKMGDLKKELTRAKRAETVAAQVKKVGDDALANATIVPSIKPVDRKAALKGELERGKKLLADGELEGNTEAKQEGERLVRLATERLNDEFAGWDQPAAAPAADPQRKARLLANLKMAENNLRRDVLGADKWVAKYRGDLDKEFPGWDKRPDPKAPAEPAEAIEEQQPHPADLEADPFAPDPEPVDMAVVASKRAALEGQGIDEPSAILTTWEKVREMLRSFRGSLPEVPTFPWTKLAQKGDKFLQANPTFYNRLKLGLRLLRSSNDYVYKAAEDEVAAVLRPLIAAGRGNFDANAYAKLRKRQGQITKLMENGERVPPGVVAEVRAMQSRLSETPLVLFQNAVLYLDLDWRARNLKDDQGNPIPLPMNLTPAEVAAILEQISVQLGASKHQQVIEQAIEKHMALVKQTADDLKERGLLAAEHLQNPYYFPHIIVEKTGGDLARVSVDTSADFRGYLVTPVGSAKAIETDYMRAMYYHLVQVFAHNQRADIVRDYFQRYDITPEVRAAAERMTKRYGRPVAVNEAFHTEFADKGYQLYGAGKGDVFPAVQIDRDRLAQRLGVPITSEDIQQQLAKLGMQGITLLPGDLRDVVNSGARETWILPDNVAEALRGMIERESRKDYLVEAGMAKLQGLWKRWILYAPWNYIRYEYGNTLADLEKLFSADPLVFTKLSGSAKEIREFYEDGKASEDLKQALKLGVMQSVTASELNALPQLKAFEELQTTKQKITKQVLARISSLFVQPVTAPAGMGDRTTTQLSQFREGVFRFAKFKADLERMRAGASPAYAGAYWRDVEAIEDSAPGAKDADFIKAAMISRSTFGDYGDISAGGDWLRKKLVPFYSWLEVNFKYHANLFRNYRDAIAAGEISRAEALKAGTRAGAVLASGLTRRAAAAFLFRLAMPYAAVALWNTLHHADIEDELSEEDRRRFHLNVGRTSDGRPLVVYLPTAFADVVKWFSGPEMARVVADYVRGCTDLGTAYSQWRDRLAPDFINNIGQSIGPLFKIPYTRFSGKNAFPDITDQRTIPGYDLRRVIISQMTDQFTGDMIMRLADKNAVAREIVNAVPGLGPDVQGDTYYSSRDFKDWARQLILQARVRDPDQWAFYQIKDKAADFEFNKTGTRDGITDRESPDQQVLRNFRKAIYRGDVEGASRFYLRLLQFGYTAERFKNSIRAQDPLYGLPKELRDDFVRSLSEWERDEVLKRAYRYYTRMSNTRGQEHALFPRKLWGEAGAQLYQQRPQTNRLQKIIDLQFDLPEPVLDHQALMELRRSLAPTPRKPARPPR